MTPTDLVSSAWTSCDNPLSLYHQSLYLGTGSCSLLFTGFAVKGIFHSKSFEYEVAIKGL